MISIITVTYNAAATLAGNLACVGSQITPAEHILIDGGSTDSTLQIAKELGTHLSTIISEPDQGIYDAMNKGINLAQGEIIGILNADDFYPSADTLARVAQVFENPEVEACYGDLLYVSEGRGTRYEARGNQKRSSITGDHSSFAISRYWKSGSYDPRKFYWGWMPPHPTFFVRRSVYERFRLFNLELGTAADYEIMLRFLLKHQIKAAYIPEVLVHMRVGGASNATVGNRVKANRMDRKAWDVNGLKPYPWTLTLKPIRKIPQWWMRP